ncbi:unnamed protein product [Soboliphyme baturini]|uniref:Homeobox domain-containing protein n=1 Tax=Soboliphyme baturini TaxID=241478 RepID=A0A183IKZ5_9BILA|nr:unnamed protein product [Soboliphyme baturini]
MQNNDRPERRRRDDGHGDDEQRFLAGHHRTSSSSSSGPTPPMYGSAAAVVAASFCDSAAAAAAASAASAAAAAAAVATRPGAGGGPGRSFCAVVADGSDMPLPPCGRTATPQAPVDPQRRGAIFPWMKESRQQQPASRLRKGSSSSQADYTADDHPQTMGETKNGK